MLILTRKAGQSLTLSLASSMAAGTTLAELFAQGHIEVRVLKTWPGTVSLGITAPVGLSIRRQELDDPARGSRPGPRG